MYRRIALSRTRIVLSLLCFGVALISPVDATDYNLQSFLGGMPGKPDLTTREFVLQWAAAASKMRAAGIKKVSTLYPMIPSGGAASIYRNYKAPDVTPSQWQATVGKLLANSSKMNYGLDYHSFKLVFAFAQKKELFDKKLQPEMSYKKWVQGVTLINAEKDAYGNIWNYGDATKFYCVWPMGCTNPDPCPKPK